MRLDKGIPFQLGTIEATIFGGPFKNYESGTRRLVGVKMAVEIDHPHEIHIDTEDFSVPDPVDMERGMIKALLAMSRGYDVYAGCMGGIGRTGLFMGCMAKLMQDYHHDKSMIWFDPVAYVRKHFKAHAIETQEQQDYVRTFNTKDVLEYAKTLVEPKVVYVERVLTPWQWAAGFFGLK